MTIYPVKWWRVNKTDNRIWISPKTSNVYWQQGQAFPSAMKTVLDYYGCPGITWKTAAEWIIKQIQEPAKAAKKPACAKSAPAPRIEPAPMPEPERKTAVEPAPAPRRASMPDPSAYGPPRIEPAPEPEQKTAPAPEDNDLLLKLIKAAQISGQGLYLYGEAGIGKSYGIEAAAKQLGLDFYTTGACLDDVPLKGFRDAAGNYHETQLYKAVVNGGVFLLDEMDVCSSEVLLALNQLIANRACEFGGDIVKAHENFIFCATGNTDLDGGDENYNGRQIIDKSFKTRFIMHRVEYNAETAEKIAGKDTVRETTVLNCGRPVNYRALKQYAGMKKAGFSIGQAWIITSKSLIKEAV
jgi:hypothetical protein